MLVVGDSRIVMPTLGPYDLVIADPPYGNTSLPWDRWPDGWLKGVAEALKPTGSMWCFGSMRMFLDHAAEFRAAGLRYAQEIVWEKQNGSVFHADRFRRVHELVVQFYRADAAWSEVYNEVQRTHDAAARTVRRKRRPVHTGQVGRGHYVSEDGGPRLMRSVLQFPNVHGRAIHPTEKPVGLLDVLVRTSCPPAGLVGDWFAGSGAVGEACLFASPSRRYIGCEADADMAEKAKRRLASILPLYA